MKVEEQIAIIYAGTNNLLKDIPVEKIVDFQTKYINYLKANYSDTLSNLKKGKFDDKIQEDLRLSIKEVSDLF